MFTNFRAHYHSTKRSLLDCSSWQYYSMHPVKSITCTVPTADSHTVSYSELCPLPRFSGVHFTAHSICHCDTKQRPDFDFQHATSHSLPSPCWCCPTAAWDQQWRHCGTGGSGLMQPVCCPGLAGPPPETSLPSPGGTPHPPGVVAPTATASKHPAYIFVQKKQNKI